MHVHGPRKQYRRQHRENPDVHNPGVWMRRRVDWHCSVWPLRTPRRRTHRRGRRHLRTARPRTNPSPTSPRKFADVDWGSRKIKPTKYVRSAGLELSSDPIGCSPRGSAMKRPLYYLLCAIACTSVVGATMPVAAIAEAIQPQETAEQRAQTDATNSDTGKAEDGTNTNAAADTV